MPYLPWFRVGPLALLTSACTGLVAGPESSSTIPVAASRDSAYVRARRALQGESFTLEVVDSAKGVLTGTRWPSSNAQPGSSAACHVTLALHIQGDASGSEVRSASRWVAPANMKEKAPTVCESERAEVLDRTAEVLAPSATP